jgi:hypothetical protein
LRHARDGEADDSCVTLRKLAVVAVVALSLLGSGAVGYYLGDRNRPAESAPVSYPVWTDQEIRFSGNGTTVGTLRCTYHLGDGSSRITETVIFVTPTTTNASSRVCR